MSFIWELRRIEKKKYALELNGDYLGKHQRRGWTFEWPLLQECIKNLLTAICPPSFQGKDKMTFGPRLHAMQSFPAMES